MRERATSEIEGRADGCRSDVQLGVEGYSR